MLKIEGLTKRFGDKLAVDNLTLSVNPGELYGFIGHNGAGKSTTIKAICGLLTPDAGEITVGGYSITREPLEAKRLLAYLPDNPDLYNFMTGIKYLNFIADVYGVPAVERRECIREYGDLFELTGELAQPVSSYSHGMKQKLALISALLHAPRLMIMDEPFVGLDPKASKAVRDILRGVCDNGGAVFFSTHVLEVAEKLCDRVAIISRGRLVASGGMEEVLGSESLEDVFFELEARATPSEMQ
ncbi:MAG: ABC transporter ATP-binding protein [Oscillospiraceae bacterium]|jgi:ABC-2 type transport system ATP-binding protein|nr:ABC transporter ATP-binding protein [Oscillospiraceae bacterium]